MASEDRLSPLKIPFSLGDDDKREKISLAQLAKFRGATVDDLITQMIGHWLERSNYNNLGDIKSLLAALEIPLELIKPYDTRLTGAMKRRHLIVHRADRNEMTGSGHHPTVTISKPLVDTWT